jgi:hypothetical protein
MTAPEVSSPSPTDGLEAPLQFSLRSLLVFQAICAVVFGMLVTIGVFTVLVVFVAALCIAVFPVQPENREWKRTAIDLLGGVVLPILCFLFDPIIICGGDGGFVGPHLQGVILFAVAMQIAALVFWRLAAPWLRKSAGVLGGILWVGAAIAGLTGFLMTPLSFIGLVVYGIGALGFVPYLTATVFARNAARACRNAETFQGGRFIFLGIVLALVVPLLANAVLGPWLLQALYAVHCQWGPGILH